MPDQEQEDYRSEAGTLASRRSLAIWIWSALFIVDTVLVTRRISGEFAKPIPGGLALLSTALVAIASVVAWRLFSRTATDDAESPWHQWQPRGLSLAATILWAWAISAGATPQSAGLLFGIVAMLLWGLIALDLGEGSSPKMHFVVDKPDVDAMADDFRTKVASTAEAVSPIELDDHPIDFELAESCGDTGDETAPGSDESLTLWLARRQTGDVEQIEGWVRVHFAAGQRETVIHVAFCPPMSACPEIETEELDGADLEIRVAAVFPFGVRLSVRRSGVLDERNTDRIGFIAQALPAQRAA